jgi:hypothetical protein
MEKLSKKLTYIGAGIGMVLFALMGLLPGSLLGGVMGLNVVGLRGRRLCGRMAPGHRGRLRKGARKNG